mmetsp:Transcript_26065/g.89599  ORF Transcript_26065/g.89599 Transcript_26065/m.89599 type:complete len:228 (+) Transcript_26065:264-947(+)
MHRRERSCARRADKFIAAGRVRRAAIVYSPVRVARRAGGVQHLGQDQGNLWLQRPLRHGAAQVRHRAAEVRRGARLKGAVRRRDAGAVERLYVVRVEPQRPERRGESFLGRVRRLLADGDGLGEVERRMLPARRQVDDVARVLDARQRRLRRRGQSRVLDGAGPVQRGGERVDLRERLARRPFAGRVGEPALGAVDDGEPRFPVRMQGQPTPRRAQREQPPRSAAGA